MLILARALNEKIIIHKDSQNIAEIEVVYLGKGRVRLGIVAPKEISIDREEIKIAKDRSCIANT